MAHETRNRTTRVVHRPGYRSPQQSTPAGEIAQVRVSVRRFDPERREVSPRRGPRAVQIPDRLASASCGSVCGGRRQPSSNQARSAFCRPPPDRLLAALRRILAPQLYVHR